VAIIFAFLRTLRGFVVKSELDGLAQVEFAVVKAAADDDAQMGRGRSWRM